MDILFFLFLSFLIIYNMVTVIISVCHMQWVIHCTNLARLWYLVVWSNTSLDITVKVYLFIFNIHNLLSVWKADYLNNVVGPYTIRWNPQMQRLRFLKEGILLQDYNIEILPEFPACRTALWISDLLAPKITWASSIINQSLYTNTDWP